MPYGNSINQVHILTYFEVFWHISILTYYWIADYEETNETSRGATFCKKSYAKGYLKDHQCTMPVGEPSAKLGLRFKCDNCYQHFPKGYIRSQ